MKHEAKATKSRLSRLMRLGLFGTSVLVLSCLLGSLSVSVEAALISTGPTPTDTTISLDGTMSFVLASGNSTLSVVDPSTDTLITTINLLQPPNTCMDVDWHQASQQVHVGCTNGTVLTVDPVLLTVTPLVANPLANYSQISADNLGGATIGWGLDSVSGWLHQFLPGGTIVPTVAIPIGTNVELIEKRIDPLAPTAQDQYLLALGTSLPGFVNVGAYDRLLGVPIPIATWNVAQRNATGIASSTTPDAFVTAVIPAGGAGDLLHLNMAAMAFVPVPIATYLTGDPKDVSMAGAFVSVIVGLSPGPGTDLHLYDAGDPASVLSVGHLPTDPVNTAAGGKSSFMGSGGSVDDLYAIHVNLGPSANSSSSSAWRKNFLSTLAPNVTSWSWANKTTGDGVRDPQEATSCKGCPRDDAIGRGLIEGPSPQPATLDNVQYATGEEVHQLPLWCITGVGVHLPVSLTWRTRTNWNGPYGEHVFLSEDVRIQTQANGDIDYFDGAGRIDRYESLGGGQYAPPPHYDTTLVTGGGATTITNRFGTVSTFDSMGRRTSVADRYGNTISYTWNGDRLTVINDTLNRNYTLAYNTTGRLSSITDFGGRVWTMSYDYLGQLRTVTTPASTQFSRVARTGSPTAPTAPRRGSGAISSTCGARRATGSKALSTTPTTWS